jgi:hypothetical protein
MTDTDVTYLSNYNNMGLARSHGPGMALTFPLSMPHSRPWARFGVRWLELRRRPSSSLFVVRDSLTPFSKPFLCKTPWLSLAAEALSPLSRPKPVPIRPPRPSTKGLPSLLLAQSHLLIRGLPILVSLSFPTLLVSLVTQKN